MRGSQKGTWPQALFTLFWPVLGVFVLRWIFAEPFVIPSGSMIPTLLVHDHIFVNKLAYGIHNPFGNGWWLRWSQPQRGDIAVFRYPKNPDVYYVKRIVGVPHDRIKLENKILYVNGIAQEKQALSEESSDLAFSGQDDEAQFEAFREGNHVVRYRKVKARDWQEGSSNPVFESEEIPEGQFFAMGDNRDQSSDSRVWKYVPIENFVGRVARIWLSCDRTLDSSPLFCDPRTLRLQRIFTAVQ